MRIYSIFSIIIACGIMAGCAQLKPALRDDSSVKLEPLIVDNVSVLKKTVDVNKGDKIVIEYRLSIPVERVEVTFYNSVNRIMHKIDVSNVEAGSNTVEWDIKFSLGEKEVSESDVYVYVIKAVGGGRSFTYNPAVNTGNKELKIEKAFIDKEIGNVTYVLPSAAWVRVRLGLRDGALLKTLEDWTVREAGRHKLNWDGWDKDTLMQFSNHPNAAIAIQAFSLADNSVILKGDKEPDLFERYQYLISGDASSYPLPINTSVLVHEPEFSIELAKNYPKTEDGLSIVNGTVPVQVTLSPRDREILINSRFEVMFYVDTVFLYEDEQAYTPFTYMWDTSGVKEGEHIFTVNIVGYNATVGIGSIRVYVAS